MKRTVPTIERVAQLDWVPLAGIRINPMAQRELKQSRVDKLVAEFDPEQFGAPTANFRDDIYHVIDGQHRIEALKKWFGDGAWEDQKIQCFVYNGLSSQEEADVFLKLNDTLAVSAFEKFMKAVHAGRPDESDVDRLVRGEGLRIARDKGDGAMSAAGTLMRIYRDQGPSVLSRTLRIIRDAYGTIGFTELVLGGVALVVHRYEDDLDDGLLTHNLAKVRGNLGALLGKAETTHKQTGQAKRQCVAAAAVEIHNAARGMPRASRLTDWWRE